MSTTRALHVLVTGATGQQGGATARALLQKGHKVRALTRKASSAAAQALAQLGAELAEGALEDRAAVVAAAAGVDSAFLVTTPFEAGPEAETRQGVIAADALREAGVGHVVFSSVGGADLRTGVPHFESKARVEEHLRAQGGAFTIVAPAFFADNLAGPLFASGLRDGTLAMPMPADRPLQQIPVEDIGRFAALVIDRREAFFGRRIDIASDELTGARLAEILSAALHRPIQYFAVPVAAVKAQSEDMGLMFEWFDRVGYSADLAGLRRDYPEVGWRTVAEWAKDAPWGALRAG